MAGSQSVPGTRGTGQSALLMVVDGLIDRMLRSPLMRRAPAQCAPEEQVAQATLLADIVGMRSLRQAVEALPSVALEQVADYWPELTALLAPTRRGPAAKTRSTASQRAAPTLGGLYDALTPDGEPQGESARDDTPDEEPRAPEHASAGSQRPDLAPLLREALNDSDKPLNTTQMLNWLHQRGAEASREEVMNALFGHEDLFKKRGPGHWLLVGRETAVS